MSALAVLRRVAGFPDPGQDPRPRRPQPPTIDSTTSAPTAGDGLFARATSSSAKAAATGRLNGPVATAWQTVPEDRSSVLWRRVLRGLLATVLVLFLLLGVRSLWVRPTATPSSANPQATYPVGEAQAIAARWAAAYLAWTPGEAAQKSREAALRLDQPIIEGAETTWDGQGTQVVLSVLPSAVNVAGDQRSGTVTVLAQVRSGKAAPSWVTLGVPTALAGDRVVVSGPGAFVALPKPGKPTPIERPSVDSAVTTETQDAAVAFLAAYAGSSPEQISQITAPGSTVAPLGGGVTLSQLVDWRVYQGGGSERTARAVVEWGTSAGGRVRQAYQLGLVQVAGGGATSWRVATVAPAAN